MAKKKEEPIVDNETGSLKVKEKTIQPVDNKTRESVTKVKEKMKMKPLVTEEAITKVDLNKPKNPEENEVKEDNANDEGVVGVNEDANASQEQEEVHSEVEAQETPTLEEVTEKEIEEVKEVIAEAAAAGVDLPENIQKLVDFMGETGGDLNDYVKLNQDYSDMDNQDLLHEFYKQTKPHLNSEEINFIMEDQFAFDEEIDSDNDIKRKKLALKEQVASAKSHLDGQKSKYYDEIKSGSKLTGEQQEAINFYKKSKEEAQTLDNAKANFLNRTNKFFGDKFKGFEYNVGDKNYRFNVNDVNKTKDTQSDINNFIGKFLDKKGQMADEAGYHKSLFTAMNSDAVAKHFYEQGMSDALKQSESSAKNIDMTPRQELGKNPNQSGMTARVLGEDSSDFKFKIKNNKFKN